MKLYITKTRIILTAFIFAALGCSDSDDTPGQNGESHSESHSESRQLTLTPIGKLNQGEDEINSHADVTARSSVKMNYRSYINLHRDITGNDNPQYARIRKLADGSYILFNQRSNDNSGNGSDVYYSTSPDLKDWTYRGILFEKYSITNKRHQNDARIYSNGNAIVLSNGDILAFASFRALHGYVWKDCKTDCGIVMRRSTDNGKTWNELQEIYHGQNWEPQMIELPRGEIHCYFTETMIMDEEEQLTANGHDSGTSLLVSEYNGETWTPGLEEPSYRVIRQPSYHSNYYDYIHTGGGMPIPILINGTDKLAVAVEKIKLGCELENSVFGISFAYSNSNYQWTDLEEEKRGPEDFQNDLFNGAGPYLVQFPSGETLVTYGLSSHMNMRMGDAAARKFGEESVALPGKGSWGCMELNGSHEVIAAMRNSDNSNDVTIQLALFELNHRIKATSRTVSVNADNAEWAATDDALFVGSKSQAQATLRCSSDENNVYFLVEVLDENISDGDYVNILLSPANEGDNLTSEARRIRIGYDGLKSTDAYAGGWKETGMEVTAQAAYDGTVSDKSDTDNGWLVELAVPKNQLDLQAGEILVNFVLFDGEEDAISNTASNKTTGWIPIAGL